MSRLFNSKKGFSFFTLVLIVVGVYFLHTQGIIDLNNILSSNKSQEQSTVPIENTTPTPPAEPEPELPDRVRVANWNLQIFGLAKSSNESLMPIYTYVINTTDIMFIQEIRSIDPVAFERLCVTLPGYECKISSRAGRSQSKEQYGLIYKKEIELVEWEDYNPDELDRWERPPVKAVFKVYGYPLTVYNIHIKPTDVVNELQHLENMIVDIGNIVVIGDLNADCKYYDYEDEPVFTDWTWAIADTADTTTSNTNCAYDRILFNWDSSNEYIGSGIWHRGINEDVSDHYMVWADIYLSER